jgi:hypothetical protein
LYGNKKLYIGFTIDMNDLKHLNVAKRVETRRKYIDMNGLNTKT